MVVVGGGGGGRGGLSSQWSSFSGSTISETLNGYTDTQMMCFRAIISGSFHQLCAILKFVISECVGVLLKWYQLFCAD